MTELPDIPVCILAGGSARRFGSPKGLAELNGQRLIDAVIDRVTIQTRGSIVLNTGPDGPYKDIALPIVPDVLHGPVGALIGLYTAMHWALNNGYDRVATCPIDVPFLPIDMFARLHNAGAPAICASLGQWHPIIGLWPTKLTESLNAFLENGVRSAHAWAEHCNATIVTFPVGPKDQDPFFNINTRADLAKVSE